MKGLPRLRNDDSRRAIGHVEAKRIEKRHECRFRFAVGNDNDVVGKYGDILASAAHDGADIHRYFLFLARWVLPKNDSLVWRGSYGRVLRYGDGLAKCRAFLE